MDVNAHNSCEQNFICIIFKSVAIEFSLLNFEGMKFFNVV